MSTLPQTFINVIRSVAESVSRQREAVVLFGEVTSVSPLKIKVDNRYEVDEAFLILDARVRETVIRIPNRSEYEHTHEMSDALTGVTAHVPLPKPDTPTPVIFTPGGATLNLRHKHTVEKALPEIMLWRGLRKGDKVRMIRFSGQIHYVVERTEGITNDPE